MHPLYLTDYIHRIKRDLTNDLCFLKQGVGEVLPKEETFASIELKWLVVAVEREVSLLKHHLFQLEKALEKQHNNANQPIQDNICGEHLPPEVCSRTK
jgi:hypothetical protein